jgi:hypothetical protein
MQAGPKRRNGEGSGYAGWSNKERGRQVGGTAYEGCCRLPPEDAADQEGDESKPTEPVRRPFPKSGTTEGYAVCLLK